MSRITAIVLAAGKGRRFKTKVSKPLAKINAKPILIYSLQVFDKHPCVSDVIVVANAGNRKKILAAIKGYRIKKAGVVVLGGRRRQDSVINGLKMLGPRADFVLIHDSARPFIKKGAVSLVMKAAESCGAAVLGVPVKYTIKEAQSSKLKAQNKNFVKKTLDRSRLWEIQTPQIFKKEIILRAYRRFGHSEVTDDASLVEKLGNAVSVVMGSYSNIKITTPEDLAIAEAIWTTE
ncbi:MAG: 2-C-methyl-D-erythritol 4-phosphate cytidylyltransferase [Deltaproteobacteria bacterium]